MVLECALLLPTVKSRSAFCESSAVGRPGGCGFRSEALATSPAPFLVYTLGRGYLGDWFRKMVDLLLGAGVFSSQPNGYAVKTSVAMDNCKFSAEYCRAEAPSSASLRFVFCLPGRTRKRTSILRPIWRWDSCKGFLCEPLLKDSKTARQASPGFGFFLCLYAYLCEATSQLRRARVAVKQNNFKHVFRCLLCARWFSGR